MKVVIVETVHAQYGLTQAELFHEAQKVFFTTKKVGDQMHALGPGLCEGQFITIHDVGEACQEIIRYCNREQVDLLSFSPIFSNFESVLRIAEGVRASTAITIHNLNYWFNARFRTWKYYKQRRLKQRVLEAFDHIVVDEGLLAYLKNERPRLFRNYSFLAVPFTLFHERGPSRHKRSADEQGRLKVVLPGSIYQESRNYQAVLEVIERFAMERAAITFSFAGPAIGEHGRKVVKRLEQANQRCAGIAAYYPMGIPETSNLFEREMETADVLLSPLNAVFDALGTREYYGKTKVPGATGDMITYQLPGIIPEYVPIPPGLKGSVFHYFTASELFQLLNRFMSEPQALQQARDQARANAYHYSAEVVRTGLAPLMGQGR